MSGTLPSLSLRGFEERKQLEAHGAIVAKGCGEVAEEEIGPYAPGPARPQPSLTLSVAGKKLPIVASLHRVKSKDIVLSTSPLSCKSSFSYADVTLILDLEGKRANLQGLRVGSFYGFEPKKPGPQITLGAKTGKEEKATFEGALRHEDVPVELSGHAQLEVCEDQ